MTSPRRERAPAAVVRLEEVCDRFESEWKASRRPRLEEYLEAAAGLDRSQLLFELLALELAYRRRLGESLDQEEYLGRFPGEAGQVEAAFAASPAATPLPSTLVGRRSHAAPLPTFIGPYRVVERLGSGAQGDVYRAVHPCLGRDVVVKLARHGLPQERRQKLIDEAAILVRLNHPGTVKVYGADLFEGRPFVVYEHVPGRSLAELLRRERLPPSRAVRLVADLAATLDRIHRHGALHLDLKPGNVLIDAAGRPRLIDFGLACLSQAWGEIGLPADGVRGTQMYMAPEQAEGVADRLGVRTDVFGLGGILYHLLTNRPPFDGKDTGEVLQRVRRAEMVPPRRLEPQVPQALERICLRALARKPEDRFASVGEMARALRAYQRRPWLLAAVVVVLGLLGALLAAWWAWPRAQSSAPPGTDGTAGRPLKGDLDVVVVRDPRGEASYLRLGGPEVLPLVPGRDWLRIEARLDRPAYLYLVWIDTEGQAHLIHPGMAGERPCKVLFLPSETEAAKLGGGPAGTETLVLLAREERLPAEVDVAALFAGLPPMTSRLPREAAWFEDGLLVRNERERSAINFSRERGKLVLEERETIKDPVIAVQALLRDEKVRRWFGYSRSVCFSNKGDR
jgi:tRNA A-37 threonylcarbamoyl transferase component Bud32